MRVPVGQFFCVEFLLFAYKLRSLLVLLELLLLLLLLFQTTQHEINEFESKPYEILALRTNKVDLLHLLKRR
ncbi:hypothetical protein GJ744_008299 [Endocarpon pusillum]|uniref:Uncharacterized protein n=1 Tax=Endocarpon pusillum TaxID=364733 RepID=A0A8H7AKT9_9EURO|nr:hypothetical protein GJ744_008299 [Endocarpon pusillum]